MNGKRLFVYMSPFLFLVCTDASVKMAHAQLQPSSSIITAHPKLERYVLNKAEIQRVRKGVLGLLKQPETARIRQITAVKDRGVVTVCGYLTAKNFSNKYEGYAPFIGTLFARGFVTTGVALGENADVVTRTCKESVFD
ncbi:hypothetical protein DUT91_02665 [Phyllobacterium salinisoli]|uniref:Uncharacterized protein n=1 Tax=Phyllobacterium salinisoli TaxID=1899321 RepID=A0A368K8K8_9HYPH|nr:hypothetical protein [Phyllobacterium salinisoli]RCS25696.1 hypothetical protein DUT91_02665 [Phyllobacterium salinisoli]